MVLGDKTQYVCIPTDSKYLGLLVTLFRHVASVITWPPAERSLVDFVVLNGVDL